LKIIGGKAIIFKVERRSVTFGQWGRRGKKGVQRISRRAIVLQRDRRGRRGSANPGEPLKYGGKKGVNYRRRGRRQHVGMETERGGEKGRVVGTIDSVAAVGGRAGTSSQ